MLLDPLLHRAASEQQSRLAALDAAGAVRWVDPAGLHLTLKFLGEVDAARLDDVRRALGVAALHPAPRLGLSGCGVFPNVARPRVIWIGLQGDVGGVARIQNDVEVALAALGWPPESRPFAAHLTVGRCRDGAVSPALRQALQAGTPATTSPEPQTRVALMRSHLGSAGSRYEELAVWKLNAAAGGAA